MKKIALSLIVFVSLANAADVIILQKATVKLIEDVQRLDEKIDSFKTKVSKATKSSKILKNNLKTIEKDFNNSVVKIEQSIDEIKAHVSNNDKFFKKAIERNKDSLDILLKNYIALKKEFGINNENTRISLKRIENKIKSIDRRISSNYSDLLDKIYKIKRGEVIIDKDIDNRVKKALSNISSFIESN